MVVLRAVSSRSGTGPSDSSLIASAADGERWAQEALYRRHARLVNGLAFRLLGNRPDADDLAQDAFVQAFQSLPRLQNRDAFASWLCSIVVRTAHKRIRRDRLMSRLGLRRTEPVDLDGILGRTAPPDVQVELRTIYRMVKELDAEDRIALVLRRVEGMSIGEIAEHLGKSIATVKRRLASAEAQLSRRLGVDDG
jgi:RNA polymerase sigma-70 factor (ECF subfamily)